MRRYTKGPSHLFERDLREKRGRRTAMHAYTWFQDIRRLEKRAAPDFAALTDDSTAACMVHAFWGPLKPNFSFCFSAVDLFFLVIAKLPKGLSATVSDCIWTLFVQVLIRVHVPVIYFNSFSHSRNRGEKLCVQAQLLCSSKQLIIFNPLFYVCLYISR